MRSPFSIDEYADSLDPWGYESNPFDRTRLNWLKAFTDHIPKNRTLDIGAGQGFLAREITTRQYVGLDISPTSTRFLSESFHKKGLSDTHVAVCGSVLDLGTLNVGKFDFIVATGVFYEHYLGANLRHLEDNINQVSEIGSYLVTVHIHNWTSLIPSRSFIELDRWYYPYREFQHELIVQKRIR